ncbi:hypothetical protein H0H87_003180 [Tephrocybe sp. NHM501043]|nr:hypothetical protein H0H87_003180 [Tephrocybe sp. NHM501043]
MSIESSSDETSRTLSLEISGFSSADSSLAPSPTGILSPSSSHTSSSTSLDERPNVKFAPLPELGPRKRRGGPLGIAARTQMVARRRMQRMAYVDAYQNNPMWTEEELEQQRVFAMNQGRLRHAQHHLLAEEDEEGADDPFLALGRMVKGAGKSLWRKVSNQELSKQVKKDIQTETPTSSILMGEAEGKKSLESAGDERVEEEEEEPTPLEKQRFVRPPTPPIKKDSENNEEGEDEDQDEQTFRTIGQTQTIREGEWISITENSIDDLTGKTPTQSSYSSLGSRM